MTKKLKYICIILFIVLSIILILKHEIWVDEAQAWLIARDIPDFASLITQMGYEGTPALWHTILLPFAKSGLPYSSMAVIHFLFMLTAIFIFIKNAPFTKFQKFLFIFGYYIFYEYNIIARSYVLSVLLLFIIASIYKNRFKKPVVYSILLFLLANTNVHSLVIAIVLTGFYAFEIKFDGNFRLSKSHFIAFAIIILGFSISIYQLLPPDDLVPAGSEWDYGLNIRQIDQRAGNALFNAFSPIPEPLVLHCTPRYPGFVGLFFFLLSLWILFRKRRPLLIYLIMSLCLLGIFLTKHPGKLRHHGLIFIIFIFSLWISKYYKEREQAKNRFISRLFSYKSISYIFITLLLCQVIGSPLAFYYDYKYDFSASKKTATFLKDNGYIGDNTFIAVFPYSQVSILPYIPEQYSKFYYVEIENYASYLVWSKKYFTKKAIFINEIIDRVDNATRNKNYQTKLIILNKRLIGWAKPYERLNLIAYFDQSIKLGETFYIYELFDSNSQ